MHADMMSLSDATQFERVIGGVGITEEDRLKTIIDWVNEDSNGREEFASNLFKHVCLACLSKEYFSTLVDSHESWSRTSWFSKFVAEVGRAFWRGEVTHLDRDRQVNNHSNFVISS